MPDDRPDLKILRPVSANIVERFRAATRQPIRYGDELVQFPPPALCGKWLWPGRLSSLTGEPGAGKGWLMARTAAAVLMGETFPAHQRAERRSVLWLNCDDFVDPKWLALCEKLPGLAEVTRDHLAMAEPPLGFRPEQVLDEFVMLATQIAEERPLFRHDGALIVIDTFRTFALIEENSSHEVAEFLSALRQVIAPAGPFPHGALWVSLHMPWQQVGVEAHERGSSAFRGNIDEPLMLRNFRQERQRLEAHNRTQRLKGFRVAQLPPLTTDEQILTVTRLKGKLAELDPLSPGTHTFAIERVPLVGPDGRFHKSAWVVPYEMSTDQVEAASAERGLEQRNEDDQAAVLRVIAAHPSVASQTTVAKLAGLSERRTVVALQLLREAGQIGGGNRLPFRILDGTLLSPES